MYMYLLPQTFIIFDIRTTVNKIETINMWLAGRKSTQVGKWFRSEIYL
jgi:hypothetical protein